MAPNTTPPYCRWLHLSDLHLINSAEDEHTRNFILYGSKGQALSHDAKTIDEGGLNWYISKHPVQCIVITGDFFFRGNFDEKTKAKLKSFLVSIYKICSDANHWNWDEGKAMDRLFWCPGNHDVNRDALIMEDGIPIYRKDKLSTAIEQGRFSPKNFRKLLTEQSFSSIYNLMCELRQEDKSQNLFETQFFQVPGLNDPSVCFLSINTALTAGQVSVENLDTEISAAYEEFFRYHNAHNSEQALLSYKKYHTYLKIRDQQVIEDDGKLCFVSDDGEHNLVKSLNQQSRRIAILIGHHPFSSFNTSSQSVFSTFVHKYGIALYLHGHTHVIQNSNPDGKTYFHPTGTQSIRSIGVGGLYLNPEDAYVQLSFSVGTIYKTGDDSFKYRIEFLIFTPASYNDRQWMKLVSPIRCECPVSTPSQSISVSPNRDMPSELQNKPSPSNSVTPINGNDNLIPKPDSSKSDGITLAQNHINEINLMFKDFRKNSIDDTNER